MDNTLLNIEIAVNDVVGNAVPSSKAIEIYSVNQLPDELFLTTLDFNQCIGIATIQVEVTRVSKGSQVEVTRVSVKKANHVTFILF